MRVVKQDTRFRFHVPSLFFGVGLGLLVVLSLIFIWINFSYQGRFIEGVHISGVSVAGLTPEQALQRLELQLQVPTHVVTLASEEHQISSTSAQLGLHYNTQHALNQAFTFGRGESPVQNVADWLAGFTDGHQVPVTMQFDAVRAQEFIHALAHLADQPGVEPFAQLRTSNAITSLLIDAGKVGQIVDQPQTFQMLQAAAGLPIATLSAAFQESGSVLSSEQVTEAQSRAGRFVGKSLQMTVDKRQQNLNDQQLIAFLQFPAGFSESKIEGYLQELSDQINRPPQNAKFEYDAQTLEVSAFTAPRDGFELNIAATTRSIIESLQVSETVQEPPQAVAVVIDRTAPEMTLENTNSLGIKERVGFGESYYDHSIPTRIHNVAHASERVNNTIVKPGEEFSFNKTLGEVSRRTGFQPAYVISGGQTVLGDGGGVCQVSTTLFRALLDSGLQITRRLPHSYRVSYYELNRDPGFDATVYSGNVDLRFINDTDQHLLLHFTTDSEKKYMTVEIYGTSDGRTTEIKDYQKWDARGALPSVYFDDPSLPAGKLVQIDWAVGGIKTKFTHVVKNAKGEVISEKTYQSNYIPWSAKFRRGTKL